MSGSVTTRPGLTQALSHLRAGDTLVVWRLDRLGRSLPHLIETVSAHVRQGVGFRSLQEQIDTTTSGGKLVFHVFGAPQSLSGISSGSGPTQAGQLPELEVGCLVGPRR